MSNTITAYFKGRVGVAESVYQNDYGIVMAFDSIDLPAHFDCYFSILNQDEAVPGVGADRQVVIPNSVLSNPGLVTIHIPVHTGSNDSEIEYIVYFKVIGRARPIDDGTPTQMTAIEQALALLQNPIGNIEQIVNEALSFTGDTFDEMKQELADDFAEYKGDVDDDIADFKTEIRGDIADVEHDFDILDGQFQTAVAAITVDSEVQGIRTGDDGVTYTSAGEAVRTQFSDVKSALSHQSYNGLCGVDSVNTNNKLYAYIDTSSQKVIEDFENHSSQSVWFKCFPNTVYRITKDVGSVFRICTTTQKPANNVSYNQTSANHTGTEIDVITGDNDNYILVYYYQGAESSAQEEMLNSISAIYGGTNLPQFLESAKDYVTYTESDMEYEGEYINPSGGISSNANFLRTNAIPIADGANYVLITDSSTIGGGCAVAFYTSGTISESNFISGVPIVYAEDVPLIVHIPTNATHYAFSTRKANTFIAKTDSFTYKWDKNHNEPANADAIEYLAGIASSDFVGKNFHFSFDDVTSCLIDLRDNTYTDIFTEHSFFTFLKNMHDTYGAVFTLNVISSIPEIGFTIAGIGTGYQSQFSGKSNWLRFSYHGYTADDDYRTSTNMQAGYNAFVNGIYTLTGSYSFVDRFVRLPSFYGTKENCLICKSLNYGAIGFLSADDTRISYYFTQAENDRLVKNGKFFDSSTQLSFIRSMTRLENVTAQQMEAEIESNIHYSKLVEVFMHEQSYKANTETMQGRISTLLLWVKDNGFKFAYPSDIYA